MIGVETGQKISEKEQRAIRVLEAKLDADRIKTAEEGAKKAKYKIQIWFKSKRSIWKPMAWTLSIWESGKRLHGGGDEMTFFCKRQKDAPRRSALPFGVISGNKVTPTLDGCGGVISGELNVNGVVVCPHCNMRWDTEHIGDSIYYYGTAQHAGEVLESWWRKLNCDADIYAKFSPQDPRTVMMSRAFNAKKARELKGLTIFPLANIIRDSAGGAEVRTLFRNFVTA